ncbi:MAG: hypothetical protein KUG65_08860 [Sphingomonadaceae bacterium]|nr:hypothetical protein [Sphingomonadaceae bacterium]
MSKKLLPYGMTGNSELIAKIGGKTNSDMLSVYGANDGSRLVAKAGPSGKKGLAGLMVYGSDRSAQLIAKDGGKVRTPALDGTGKRVVRLNARR